MGACFTSSRIARNDNLVSSRELSFDFPVLYVAVRRHLAGRYEPLFGRLVLGGFVQLNQSYINHRRNSNALQVGVPSGQNDKREIPKSLEKEIGTKNLNSTLND